MASKIPQWLVGRLLAVVMLSGLGVGGVHMVQQQAQLSSAEFERAQADPYVRAVAADTSTSPAVKLAMVLGHFYESSGKHIGWPYVDKLGKGQPLTVCNGITGQGVIAGKWYSPADCYKLEKGRYLQAERAAKRMFAHWVGYNVWVRASIIDMIYNLGEGAVSGSTMRAQANAGHSPDVWCPQMQRWVRGTVNGKSVVLPGLVGRRDTTAELCKDWGRDGHFSAALIEQSREEVRP